MSARGGGEGMTRWSVAGLSVSRDRESRSWSQPARHCGWQKWGARSGEEGMRGGEGSRSSRGWWWRSGGGRREVTMRDPLSRSGGMAGGG